MGIRFHCHHCNHGLHVKDFQAGKRGKCPSCQGSFRVPQRDASFSLSIEELSTSDSAIVSPIRSKTKPISSPSPAAPKPTSLQPKQTSSRSASIASPTAGPTPSNAPVQPVQPKAKRENQPDLPSPLSSGAPLPNDGLSANPASATGLPSSLLPWIDARWFIRPPSGGQYGPATTSQLVDWIAERRVTHDSFLWRDGLETWQTAIELIPEPFANNATIDTVTPQSIPKDVPPPVPNHDLLREASPGSLASSKAAVSVKRKKQQTQQWIILGLLITLAISLTGVLIYILVR